MGFVKNNKVVLWFVAAIALVALPFAFNAFKVAAAGEAVALNEDCSYVYDDQTGTMEFSGSGEAVFDVTMSEFFENGSFIFGGGLNKIVIGEGFARIDSKALSFLKDESVTDEISFDLVINAPVKKLEDFTFEAIPIRSVELPVSLESIGMRVMLGTDIESLVIPEGVKNIGMVSFINCDGLKTVYLPSTIEYVNLTAFAKCPSLEAVYYAGTNTDWAATKYHYNYYYIDILNNELTNGNYGYDLANEKIRFSESAYQTADKWTKNGGKWYGYKDGKALSGLVLDEGKLYYLDGNGMMLKGWQEIDGEWYYFNSDMKYGWKRISGKWYYFDPKTGGMLKDTVKMIDGKYYVFSKTGALAINKWSRLVMYFLEDEIDETVEGFLRFWVHSDGEGVQLKGTTITENGVDYSFDSLFGAWTDDPEHPPVVIEKY